jgi:uncharacterized protein YpmB
MSKPCRLCESNEEVELYTYKHRGLWEVGYLCKDCWVIHFGSGKYATDDEEGENLFQEVEAG